MSIKLKNAKNDAESQGLTMLLYSKPKTGKTSFLSTLEGKVLLIDLEKGWGVLNQCENIDVLEVDPDMKKWSEIWDYVQEIEGYDYICMDGVTELVEAMKRAYRKMRGGKLQLQDYDALYNQVKDVMRVFRDLRAKGISVIVTAQEQQIKEQQDDMSLITTTHPLLPEKIVSGIEGLFDIIARIEVSEKKGKEGVRFLRLDRTKNIVAGNRINNKKVCLADMQDFLNKEK